MRNARCFMAGLFCLLVCAGGRMQAEAPAALEGSKKPQVDWTRIITVLAQQKQSRAELPKAPARGPRRGRTGHPRLFIHKGNRKQFLRKLSDPQLAKIWQSIHSRGTGAAKDIDASLKYILNAKEKKFYRLAWHLPSTVGNAALVYSLTKDKACGEFCKRALLELITWETWSSKEYHTRHKLKVGLRMGRVAMAMGMAYDAAYNLMTDRQRVKAREAILRLGIQPVYDEYVVGKRRGFLTNWMAVNVGGAGICALAIAGDDPENPRAMDKYIEGFVDRYKAMINKTVGPDGGYEEGIGYLSYGFEILPFFVVAAREAGVDFFKQTALDKVWTFPAYLLVPSKRGYANFGDCSYSCKVVNHIFSMCAAYTGDGHPQWFYRNGRNIVGTGGFVNFLVYDRDIKPIPPDDLPTSRLFRKFGFASMRSDWKEDAVFLAFHSGPVLCHGHVARNTFMLEAFGEPLAIDIGNPGGYGSSHYKMYYRRPGAHNVILVDDDTMSQEYGDAGRITEFLGSRCYDAVTGEVPTARLKTNRREIVFVKPHYFVMLDTMVSTGKAHRMNWLLHPPAKGKDNITLDGKDGSDFTIRQGKARLSVKFFAPVGFKTRIRTGPPGDRFVSVDTPKAVKKAQFLCVMYPRKARASLPAIEKISARYPAGGGCFGVKVTRKKATDYVLFGRRSISYRDIRCNGPKCTVSVAANGRVFQRFAMHDATGLSYGKRTLLASSARCTAAFGSERKNRLFGCLDLDKTTDVSVAIDFVPRAVWLDGEKLDKEKFVYKEGTVKLPGLTSGRHSLRFE